MSRQVAEDGFYYFIERQYINNNTSKRWISKYMCLQQDGYEYIENIQVNFAIHKQVNNSLQFLLHIRSRD